MTTVWTDMTSAMTDLTTAEMNPTTAEMGMTIAEMENRNHYSFYRPYLRHRSRGKSKGYDGEHLP